MHLFNRTLAESLQTKTVHVLLLFALWNGILGDRLLFSRGRASSTVSLFREGEHTLDGGTPG